MRLSMIKAACAVVLGFVFTAGAPASAETMGMWDYQSAKTFCSIGTAQDGNKFLMMTTKSGASGVMIVPADQSLITVGTDYTLMISLKGSPEFETSGNAGEFGGAKVLYLKIKGNKIAAGEPDGFQFHSSLNGTVIFDKDMRGSTDAFAAFVSCSQAFGAN